jgi:hypothetical protein
MPPYIGVEIQTISMTLTVITPLRVGIQTPCGHQEPMFWNILRSAL